MSKRKPKILPPVAAAPPAALPSPAAKAPRPDYLAEELAGLRNERAARPRRQVAPSGTEARPWIETRVSQPAGATSAIARPVHYPREQARPPEVAPASRRRRRGEPAEPPRLTREQALDLFARGVWSAAVALGVGLSWDDPEWRAGRFRPAALLDALARVEAEESTAFPLPGSPRLDGVGGGRRVAADGSPGVPQSWVRWIDREADVERAAHAHMTSARRLARSPLMLAQLALARRDPLLWRTYAAAVLVPPGQGGGVAGASQRLGEPVAKVRRRLDQARAHLLASLALYGGEASDEEYEALVAALR